MKTKVLAILFLTVLLIGLAGASAGAALAAFGPFHPGQALFSIQNTAEHAYGALLNDPTGRAQYEVTLLDRRVNSLVSVQGTALEVDALGAISTEIDHVLTRFADLPPGQEADFRTIFIDILGNLMSSLDNSGYLPQALPQILEDFRSMVLALIKQVEEPTQSLQALSFTGVSIEEAVPLKAKEPVTPIIFARIDPRAIPFPVGSGGAKHLFFPLDGKHSEIACQSCHTEGNYSGTPNQCTDCHLENKPVQHFDGPCMLCHSTSAWLPSTFDHQAAGAVDCQSCHLTVRPANHFPGQCSACHSTTTWQPANFDHLTAGAVNCQSCHSSVRPANHYPGQCSACHSPSAWIPANFNHQVAGATDCVSCHSNRKPANHFSGQCSACHSTSAWLPASFNHQAAGATDCASCHSNRKPANHFAGQCSACHSTSGWLPATFNHAAAGATDCQSCHAVNRPANHFSGQCSACHSTSGWRPASFNHAAAGATDCQSCHSGNRPANHFSGQCSDCHSTSGWTPANFNHSFPIDHKDANGVCAKCHPSGGSSWTCWTCHNESELTKKHEEKGIPDFVARCMECHGDGRKHD